jgi:hypothetical protein
MTSGKFSLLAIGAIASFGLGVVVGPHLTGDSHDRADVAQQAAVDVPSPIDTADATPTTRRRVPRVMPAVPATSTDLHSRLRPVLYQGTNMEIAAEGFRDGEHFATVAHAARNTDVPFVLLKHRVLAEGKSLAAAIRDSKPAIDAAAQADLAMAQARVDIATIKG